MSHSKCTLAEANYALIGNYSLSVVIVDIGEFNKQQVSQLLNHIQQSIAAYAPPPIITEKVLFWVGYTNEVKQKKTIYLREIYDYYQALELSKKKHSLDKVIMGFTITSQQLMQVAGIATKNHN